MHSYRLAQLAPEASDPLDAQIEREDLSQVLDAVIAGLPTQKRQVMCLRKAAGANPEIAEISSTRSTPSVRTTRRASNSRKPLGRIVLLIVTLQTLFFYNDPKNSA